jgi:signal transduction histidine kinase
VDPARAETRGPGVGIRLGRAPINWLLRLGLLILTVIQVLTLQQSGPHPAALYTLLGCAGLAWIGWLWVRPWTAEASGDGNKAALLLALIAFSSGAATLIDGPGWAANLTGAAVLEGGATLRWWTSAGVMLSSLLGLAVGALLHGANAYGIFGQLPTVLYLAFYFFLFVCLMLTGLARGARREQLAQARMALAERERAAALNERTRIAREIHDILAHSLADLSIQLELADALLTDSGDRSGALERVRYAHRLATNGIEETRHAIHALRSNSPPLPEALAAMVGNYHRAGSSVDLEVEGEPRPLPAATGIAILRTAQEALANSHKHAAGLCIQVRLTYGRGGVSLTVSDRAQGAVGNDLQSPPSRSSRPPVFAGAGGYGLAGMRERLLLAGGSLTAGPDAEGWSVHAEVPG